MAELFRYQRRSEGGAFNVPADCIKVTALRVFYCFSDGTLIDFPNNRKKE